MLSAHHFCYCVFRQNMKLLAAERLQTKATERSDHQRKVFQFEQEMCAKETGVRLE